MCLDGGASFHFFSLSSLDAWSTIVGEAASTNLWRTAWTHNALCGFRAGATHCVVIVADTNSHRQTFYPVMASFVSGELGNAIVPIILSSRRQKFDRYIQHAVNKILLYVYGSFSHSPNVQVDTLSSTYRKWTALQEHKYFFFQFYLLNANDRPIS